MGALDVSRQVAISCVDIASSANNASHYSLLLFLFVCFGHKQSLNSSAKNVTQYCFFFLFFFKCAVFLF